jgi:hypothetical protein
LHTLLELLRNLGLILLHSFALASLLLQQTKLLLGCIFLIFAVV